MKRANVGVVLRMVGLVLAAITVYSGYRIKVSAMETIGWDWSRGPTYIFSSDYKGDHRLALILGCYGAAVAAIACFVISIWLTVRKGTPDGR